MSIRFQGQYLIKSIRLKNWDYSSNGAYFITICTKNREKYFGTVNNGAVLLSEIGAIIKKYWLEIPKHFPHIILDEYIIMPDHIHGILIIQKNIKYHHIRQSTRSENNKTTSKNMSQKSPKKNTISVVIRSFKSACTKSINEKWNNIFFQWQPRFYDHIIRNNKELFRIRNYIINNPKKWDLKNNL